MTFFSEIIGFFVARKKIWLIPLFLLLSIVGACTVITSSSTAVSPLIYAIF